MMLDFLSNLFRSLSPLWEMSVTAAYAAAVVIALRLLLKKRAPKQVLCLLWLVVFARLLIPVSLESPLSIVPNALPGQEQQTYLSTQAAEGHASGAPAQPQGSLQDDDQDLPAGGAAAPVLSNSAQPALSAPQGAISAAPQQPVKKGFPWQAAAAGMWLAGAAAMGAYALVSYLRLRRRLFDAIRARDGAWEHPAVTSPFILGMLRPRIYLPAGLRGQPRQFILCHEQAHLRRLDHIVKPVCWIALALHWFNPMVWAAFILMSRDIESACDEAVVRQLGSEVKADYSSTLLALATGRQAPSPCPLSFDEGDARSRIQNVLRYQRPTLWIVVVSIIAAALAAICLLTDPVAAKTPGEDPPSSPAVSQEPTPEAAPTPTPEPVLTPADHTLDPWMMEVLSGKRTFHRMGTAYPEDFTIDQLRSYFYGDEELPKTTVEVGVVTVLDLDQDGANELVIWPTGEHDDPTDVGYYTGYLILRLEGDSVSGYAPGWRSIGWLKNDGTFDWSSSAFEWGTGSAQFTENGFEVHEITWCELHSETDERYFVDGQPTTKEEFEAAITAQAAKPDPFWGRWYPDTGLLPQAVASDQSTYTPKFLGDGMRELYRQASYFYYHLFGESTMGICEMDSSAIWPSGLYDPTATVERDGLTYVQATGQFSQWADLEAAALSLFTEDFWNACNQWNGHKLFINVDGITYFLPVSRVNGDYYGAGPSPFTLGEQSEDAVTVTLTVGYNRYREGESEEQWSQRVSSSYDYTADYTIRYVRTEQGWRFDEFHYPRTDRRDYTMGHILWQTDPLYAANGSMDDVTLRQIGSNIYLDWGKTTYPLESEVNSATFTGRMYAMDVDEDGDTEVSLVYLNADNSPIIAVYERTGSGLRRVTFDTSKLVEDCFDPFVTVERNPGGGLTIEHHGPREITAIELSDAVFEGYEWMQEGELYAKMDSEFFYVGLASEMPLSPPFSVHSFIRLSDGVNDGSYVASIVFQVDYYDGGSYMIPGSLYLEAYSEFAVSDS